MTPVNVTLKAWPELQREVAAGTARPGDLVCLTQEDSLSLAAWIKDVQRWQSEATKVIDFHERMNQNGVSSKDPAAEEKRP
ncbi:MAG TPA: hypothetical protein VKA48_01725 [Gammaproteobacteria bacterium]|nr:hypothetical protein [Gammaproteobacteria bacterium]